MSIEPPDTHPTPKWATTLVNAANSRNRARGSVELFSIEDLVAVWKRCGGRCALSELAFDFRVVGDGQARRPFAPSLDRVDRHKPYRRDNVRLVVSIANFAMNAWGEEPLTQLASAVHHKFGQRSVPSRPTPVDSELDDIATTDADIVETDVGPLPFPPRSDLHVPILVMLKNGPKSSRDIESALADRFGITDRMRVALLRSGCPAWRNHVAWALVDLVKHRGGRGGTGQIERIKSGPAPNGGSMGVYGLTGMQA